MICSVGRRHGSDLVLLWLWCRPAATAPIRPLAWRQSPYASGVALEKGQKTKKKKKKKKKFFEAACIWKRAWFQVLALHFSTYSIPFPTDNFCEDFHDRNISFSQSPLHITHHSQLISIYLTKYWHYLSFSQFPRGSYHCRRTPPQTRWWLLLRWNEHCSR